MLHYGPRRGIIAKDSEMCRAYNRLPAVWLFGDEFHLLSLDDLRTLRRGYNPNDALALAEALELTGNPTQQALIESARCCMARGDRNLRVLSLRVLRHQSGDQAASAVLEGLHDPAPRVCAAAIQACPNYLRDADIVARLEAIAADTRLKRKLRRRALSMLAGDEGRQPGDLTPPVYSALEGLLRQPAYRFAIVLGLARLKLAPGVKALLDTVAQADDSRAGLMARRALAGHRVIHIDAYTHDPALHRRITRSCQIAHGRMFYWLPRAGLPLDERA